MLSFVRKLGVALVLVFVILFGFQNLTALSTLVRFRFDYYVPGWVFVTPEFPVVFLLVAIFLLGMLVAGFQGFYESLARRLDIRKRDRRIRDLEREVAELQAQLDTAAPKPSSASSRAATPEVPLLEENPTL
ncbi:MAG: DUF1049 domain-containing protein [Deltaproteobacteria bacterium]|nr:DUF1049 domain-containing protein [Deltaproteobacteria bacterium]